MVDSMRAKTYTYFWSIVCAKALHFDVKSGREVLFLVDVPIITSFFGTVSRIRDRNICWCVYIMTDVYSILCGRGGGLRNIFNILRMFLFSI